MANPFAYAQPLDYSAGLYVVPVLKSLDGDLFPNDPVVTSLSRFKTLFYEALAAACNVLQIGPESLELVMHLLYAFSRIVVVVLIYTIARVLTNSTWLFIIMATWFSFPQGSLLSATGLFRSQTMEHGWVGYILGLAAIVALLRKRYCLFWLTLSLALLVHPLVGFHLFLCTGAPVLLLTSSRVKRLAPGLILFAVSTLVYVLWLAPPPLTRRAAEMLISTKRTYSNVVPFGQRPTDWVNTLVTVSLAYLAYRHLDTTDKNARFMLGFIISGVFFGLSISAITAIVSSPRPMYLLSTDIPLRLVQFQPARIFVWVTLFTDVVLAMVAARALQQRRIVGFILLAVVVYGILGSAWAIAFKVFGLGYFLATDLAFTDRRLGSDGLEVLTRQGVVLIAIGIFAGWVFSDKLPYQSFGETLGLAPAILLVVGTSLSSGRRTTWQSVIIGSVLVYVITVGVIVQHVKYRRTVDSHWNEVRYWVQQNTDKDSRFMTLPGNQLIHFRTLALRTSVNEPVGSLIWVDPFEFWRTEARSQRSLSAYQDEIWELKQAFLLAEEWKADYVVVKGPYRPAVEPLFNSGPYNIIAVPQGHVNEKLARQLDTTP